MGRGVICSGVSTLVPASVDSLVMIQTCTSIDGSLFSFFLWPFPNGILSYGPLSLGIFNHRVPIKWKEVKEEAYFLRQCCPKPCNSSTHVATSHVLSNARILCLLQSVAVRKTPLLVTRARALLWTKVEVSE